LKLNFLIALGALCFFTGKKRVSPMVHFFIPFYSNYLLEQVSAQQGFYLNHRPKDNFWPVESTVLVLKSVLMYGFVLNRRQYLEYEIEVNLHEKERYRNDYH